MLKRLTLGLTFAMLSATTLFAANVPEQATSRIPWDRLVSQALDALCTYVGIGCV